MPLRFAEASLALLALGIGMGPSGARADDAGHDCIVSRWALTKEIEGRAPGAESAEFSRADHRVFAYAALDCTRIEAPLHFLFFRNGINYAVVTQSVQPSRNWRTWAAVKAIPGNWTARLLIGSRVLLEDTFIVKP
jgi:hypothetical protein